MINHLSSLPRPNLEPLVLELYSLPALKDALNLKLNLEYSDELVKKFEKKLGKALMPANPERMSMSAAKQILSEVKGAGGHFSSGGSKCLPICGRMCL